MTDDAQQTIGLAEAVRQALDQAGIDLLRSPGRFLGTLLDFVDPESPPMRLLARNCDDEFLAPLVLACAKGQPTVDDLHEAGMRCTQVLVLDRSIAEEPARRLANLLCEGITLHLGLRQAGPSSEAATPGSRSQTWTQPGPPLQQKADPLGQTSQPQRTKTNPVGARASAQASAADKPAAAPAQAAPSAAQAAPSTGQPTQPPTQPPASAPATRSAAQQRKRLRTIAACAAALALVAAFVHVALRSTVRFDGNGQTSGNTRAIGTWKHSTVTLPECSFEREGYAFVGWTLGDPHDLLQPGDTVDVDESQTYEAVWAPLARFLGNGADSGSVADIPIAGQDSITLPTNAYKRDGYRFGGWSLATDGSSPAKAKTKVAVHEEPLTYYVAWRPEVTYDGNGADSGEVKTTSAAPNGRIKLSKNGYKRSGYRFVGWSTNYSGKPTRAGKRITVNGPTKLYAVWRPGVSFEANGATGGSTATAYADASGSATLPDCGFSWAYHSFEGWATVPNGDVSYQPGDSYSLSVPRELYAVWALDPSIVEKLDVEPIDRTWEHGDSRSRILRVRNDSDTTLKVEASFSWKNASGAQVAISSDSMAAVAPGETTLLYGSSSNPNVTGVEHSLSAQDMSLGRSSLWNQVSVEEETVEYGHLVLRLTNNGSTDALVWSLMAYGLGSNGGESLSGENVIKTLSPGESTEVSIDSGNDWRAEWPEYYSRTYYLDGYML